MGSILKVNFHVIKLIYHKTMKEFTTRKKKATKRDSWKTMAVFKELVLLGHFMCSECTRSFV